ncbi:MAG TPA: LON peptidase substrate-binding domain-containing protein [Dermatophilaceae bacterium]|nr:LON peptidase substrate-binding domain-containing protein [Dermatophilaceae bacterium]
MPSLPLFPLGTVLFPGARLPLQVFEPRYLVLMEELLGRGEDDRCFGIVAIRKGYEVGAEGASELATVGCEARIDAVLADSRGGQPIVQVVCTGTRRFSFDAVDHTAGTPYTTGLVTWLDDGAGADDPATARLAGQLVAAHAAYCEVLGIDAVELRDTPQRLAYRAAEHTALEPRERQAVLEAPDAPSRLRLVLGLLRREQALAGRFRVVPPQPYPGGANLN